MGVKLLGRLFCAVPGDMAVPQEDTADPPAGPVVWDLMCPACVSPFCHG